MGLQLAMSRENIKTLMAIVVLFLVLPVVMLRARDRGYLKRAWGILALLAGLGILVALFRYYGPGKGHDWDTGGSVGLGLAAVLFWLGPRWVRNGGPGIEHLPNDFKCEELEASIEKARASLPWFLEQVERNVDGAFIKFPLRTPNGNEEHIWACVHSFRKGDFNVSLANDPFDRDQKADGRLDVPLEEIEDWQVLYPDGRIKGSYSVIAILQNFESRGKLSRRMREQRTRLIDAGTPDRT